VSVSVSGRRLDATTAVACALTAVACAAAYGGLFSHAYPGDTSVYAGYGRALVQDGRIPYRDFYDEYPPGTVPVFVLPALVWNAHYVLVLKLWMTLCAVGFTWCAAWTLQRLGLSPLRLVPVVLAPVLLGPVFLNRYDPLPALLTSLALVAQLRSREKTTGALLGVATALKIYSAAVLPVAARRVRSLRGGGTAAFVVAATVLTLPLFLIAPGGVGYSFSTQLRRHLQIESLGASILLAGSKLGVHHVGWIRGKPGSIDLGGRLPDVVGVLSSVLAVALVILVARAYWRGRDDDRRLVTAWAAAVAAFTVFGKVLSPQYLVWLVPLVPLAAGRKGLWAGVSLLGALALTQPEYLLHRYGLRNQDWTVWLLVLRNALLVASFCFLYAQLRPGRSEASVRLPA
jgi:Glycosyltransferase family 87